jgi:ketosteroid isomerase-like protein
MSEENVEIVRRFCEAYLRGDHAGAAGYLAPDVVYEVGQELPARGPGELMAKWQRWESDWEWLETVFEEFIDAGDQVVVTVRYSGRGRASGVELQDRLFEVHTLRDGKCVRKRDFRERSEALEAAGLSE